MRWRAGVDIGGTFTDFALYDEQEGRPITGKRLTTPKDRCVAALAGLFELLGRHQATATSAPSAPARSGCGQLPRPCYAAPADSV